MSSFPPDMDPELAALLRELDAIPAPAPPPPALKSAPPSAPKPPPPPPAAGKKQPVLKPFKKTATVPAPAQTYPPDMDPELAALLGQLEDPNYQSTAKPKLFKPSVPPPAWWSAQTNPIRAAATPSTVTKVDSGSNLRQDRPEWRNKLQEAERIMKDTNSCKQMEADVYKQLIEGAAIIERIPQPKKVVRVFVSSTFTDTEAERNLLMTDVFPYLTHLCHLMSVQFEIVDMRWGVREFTNDDHGTFNLCMSELHKCRRESMGPAFFCLLGDKYGFRPFPNKIEQTELEKMWEKIREEEIQKATKELPDVAGKISYIASSVSLPLLWDSFDEESQTALANADLMLIPRWYKLDTNSEPPSYVLQAITVFIPEFRSPDDAVRRAAGGRWWKIFEELAVLLRIGSAALSKEQQEKYFISVTEAEVHNGILLNHERNSQSFCCRRQIENATEFPSSIASRPKFVDLLPDKQVDHEAHSMLDELKMKKVPQVLPESNIQDYSVSPALVSGEGLTQAEQVERQKYLENFADNFCTKIVDAIFAGYKENQIATTPLLNELIQQYVFRAAKCSNLTAREDTLSPIMSYLVSNRPTAHVVWGESGSGKTSLMATALLRIKERQPNAHIVYRFVGVTPSSSGARQLMRSVYSQIAELLSGVKHETRDDNKPCDADDDYDVYQTPTEFRYLVKYFPALLAKANQMRPIYIFLDSLDQLSDEDSGRSLRWLPFVLPPHVKLVVSVLPSLLDTVKSLHKGGDECYTNVPAMNLWDGLPIMKQWLKAANRTLTSRQQDTAMKAFENSPLPLFLRVATDIIIKWPSYLPEESCTLETDLPSLIANSIFHRIELIHGEKLVSHALGYITASKDGLSYNELEDILSCDEDVLSDVYQWWTPPVRVLPPMLWKRIRDDLGAYLVERGSSDAVVYRWYHRQFWEAAESRYLKNDVQVVPRLPVGDGKTSYSQKQARHIAMAKYFNGDWSSPTLVSYIERTGQVEKSDRLISEQPLEFSKTVFNIRKLTELPYHQTLGDMPDSYASTLYNFNFITAKCSANLHYELLQDYQFAIDNIDGVRHRGHKECLIGFQSFLVKQMHHLIIYPNMALQLAFNSPDSLQVSLDAMIQSLDNTHPLIQWANKSQNIDPCLRTFAGPDNVDYFDLSKDETKIATACWDNSIKIYNFENGAEIATLVGHTKGVTAVKFFADGKLLISCSEDETVRVWDALSGTLNATYEGHTDTITECAVSPDGAFGISSSEDGTVRVWDLNLRTCAYVLDDHKGEVWSCTYSPEGDLFASAGKDGIIVWNAQSYNLLFRLQGHKLDTDTVSFSPDGKYILSTSSDHRCIIWNVQTKKQATYVPFGCKNIARFAHALSNDGEKIAIGVNEDLKVYNKTTGKVVVTFVGHEDHITGIKYTRDGKYIVTSSWDKTVKVWDATAHQVVRNNKVHTGNVQGCAFLPDGRHFVSGANDKTIKTWRLEDHSEVNSISISSPVRSMRCAADGKHVLVALNGQNFASLLDTSTGEVTKQYKQHRNEEELGGVCFSPDGNVVASCSEDKTLRLFDACSCEQLALMKHKDEVGCLAYSADGQKIVTGVWEGSTIVWNALPPYNQLLQLRGVAKLFVPAFVAFSPDGKLVTAGSDKTIALWDSTTGELKHTLQCQKEDEIHSYKFLSNNRIFCVGHQALYLFDLTLSPPCFARFLHPYPCDFASGDMMGDKIVAFDYEGGIYFLQVSNWPPENCNE